MTRLAGSWLEELVEFLRIPSVSAEPAHADDVQLAAAWVRDFIRRAGGEAEIVSQSGSPVVTGEVRSTAGAHAPTVLVYGHFDVQPPDPLELWESPPFEPAVRNGVLYARGVVDDKGQLFSLLKAVEILAHAGTLPVNVRFACDGEEEIGGHAIADFITSDERGADACLIYDSTVIRPGEPAFVVATRGLLYFHVRVRTGDTDLHSGLYGGAALNALHALMQSLSVVLPSHGRLPEPLRDGIVAPTSGELIGWEGLPPGGDELAERGARPADAQAAEELYVRTFAEPSLDVNGIAGGSADSFKTVLPVEARANVSIRLVPVQDPRAIAAAFERLVRDAAPEGAEIAIELASSGAPASIDPATVAIQLARDAVERATGAQPLLIRWGASLPVISALAERGIPTVLTGFALPDCRMHAPNEQMPLSSIEQGIEAAIEILRAWADCPRVG